MFIDRSTAWGICVADWKSTGIRNGNISTYYVAVAECYCSLSFIGDWVRLNYPHGFWYEHNHKEESHHQESEGTRTYLLLNCTKPTCSLYALRTYHFLKSTGIAPTVDWSQWSESLVAEIVESSLIWSWPLHIPSLSTRHYGFVNIEYSNEPNKGILVQPPTADRNRNSTRHHHHHHHS